MTKFHLIVVTLILYSSNLSISQSLLLIDNNYNSFVHYSESELWISSQGGWNRYDGNQTYHYLCGDLDSGLKGEWIQSGFYSDKKNRLWTCTFEYLCKYDSEIDKFDCFQPFENVPISKSGLRLLGIDHQRNHPILRYNDGLFYHDENAKSLIPLCKDNTTSATLLKFFPKENMIISVGYMDNQKVEIWLRDKTFWNKQTYDFSLCSKMVNITARDVVIKDNIIFIASNAGLIRLNTLDHCNSELIFFKSQDFNTFSIIKKDKFLILSTDKFGLLFFNTITNKWVESITMDHVSLPLAKNHPKELFDLKKGILISYRNTDPQIIEWKKILPLLDFQSSIKTKFITESLNIYKEFSVTNHRKGDIELYKNGILIKEISVTPDASIRNIQFMGDQLYFHDESKLWKYEIAHDKLSIIYKNDKKALQEVFVSPYGLIAIIENKAWKIKGAELKNVLPDTLNKDIISHHILSKEISLTTKYNQAILINKTDTTIIETDSYIYDYHLEGSILYLAQGNGLGVYNLVNKEYETIQIEHSRINTIFSSLDSTLFLASSKGIYHYTKNSTFYRLPTKKQNIKELVVQDSSIFYISEDGFNAFAGSEYKNSNQKKINLNSFNHTPLKSNSEILYFNYRYNDQPLRFSVMSNCYRSNQLGSVNYTVLQNEFIVEDKELGDELLLPALRSGNYDIEISASDYLGNNFHPIKLHLNIEGPLWQKWWFILGTILAIALLLWRYFKNQTNYLKKEVEIKNEITRLEKSALQAQMNPHFIFNCLNSIQGFIMENNKEQAMEYLGSFAQLIRSNLNASISNKISLAEEYRILNNYLKLERLRLNESFEYEITLPSQKDAHDIMIPPMLIQPFAENAVIHGMRNDLKNGLIKIDFTLTDSALNVTIIDNGDSKSPHTHKNGHKSVGVEITRKRLNFINQSNQSINDLSIDHSPNGTTVSLSIHLD